mmetsp:Transcript_5398/g.9646  ORF Transcript_5398/g.9646 Transcript_5398/m.9646 type:complete len:98 (+) Transcript_5398:41-334(+)
MKRTDLSAPVEMEIDPQDFAKRCRIDPETPSSPELQSSSPSSGSEALTRSLLRYVRCGRYIDRSGVAEHEEDPAAPHEPHWGNSYRSLLEQARCLRE